MRVFITGGCGFIGSNFVSFLLNNHQKLGIEKVVNLDKQTYAGQGKNFEHMGLNSNPKYKFVRGDIADVSIVDEIFEKDKPDFVINFAAESHVDRSIEDSSPFIKTNIEGTRILLEHAKKYSVEKFVQIGTDEVYGSLEQNSKSSKETDVLKPRSPYSASKAAADLLALSYYETYELPICVTRSANNYGAYQFPEKILPLFITNLSEGKKVPLMWSDKNPGLNIRDWLHVKDNCRAIWHILNRGNNGEIYNIPGENEKTNIELTIILLDHFNYELKMVEKIPHRLGHDFRYSINGKKLLDLGFEYKHKDLNLELKEIINWYKKNKSWWGPLK